MFSGPYMILEVSHSISPGKFDTSFTGVRQPIANLPINLDFTQTLKTNLVQKILQKKKEDVEKQRALESKNQISNKNNIVNNSLGTNQPSNSSECSGITRYEKFVKIDKDAKASTATAQQVKNKITEIGQNLGITSIVMNKIKYAVFAQMFVQGGNGTSFVGLENNFIGVDLNSNWGNSESYFSTERKYFCVKRNDKILPYVAFDSVDKNIEFLLSRWRLKASLINQVTADNIALFINTNLKPNSSSPNNWYSLDNADKSKIVAKVQEAINLYDATN